MTNLLATPFASIPDASRIGHLLPLPARIDRIDRDKPLGQATGLPGIHVDAHGGPDEISERFGAVDQEKTVCKLRRLKPHFVLKHSKFSRRDRRAILPCRDKIGGKLLRSHRSIGKQ
ncbi:hypothetical protein [Bradyrhizobium sp.]|uniref:hypothetical protein n=1 Tax=Bradyrhizobium sp. TaxID=376 RepID=UPI003C44F767